MLCTLQENTYMPFCCFKAQECLKKKTTQPYIPEKKNPQKPKHPKKLLEKTESILSMKKQIAIAEIHS